MHRLQIQVVGGLVQQQHAGLAEKRLGQQDAHLLAALQLRHLALMQRFRNIQTLEQNRGVRFRGIAAFVSDNALELAHAHAVFVGPVGGIGVERFTLLQRVPERSVAHDHRIQNAVGIEGELILAQDPDLLRPGYGTLGGFNFAGQDFHERGFARSIGAGDGVAPSLLEGGGHVFKKNAGAEAHGNVVD